MLGVHGKRMIIIMNSLFQLKSDTLQDSKATRIPSSGLGVANVSPGAALSHGVGAATMSVKLLSSIISGWALVVTSLGSDHQDTQAPQVAPLLLAFQMYSRLLYSLPCVESSDIFCCNFCISKIRRCFDYSVCQESRPTPVTSAVDGLHLS